MNVVRERRINAGDALPVEQAQAPSNNLAVLLDARRFDPASPPPSVVPVFSLGNAVIATPGNLVAIQAQAKAGKSAFVFAMLGAAMGGHNDCLGVSASNPNGRALIHFDTEQSPADHHAGIERALRRAGLKEPPPWLRSYRLADVPVAFRRMALKFELERADAEHGGIHSVLIDGLGDLCVDPNDPAEAFGLIDELHQLAIRYDAPIVSALHENPGSESGKTRGHLGSQLERKAETNLRLAKDGAGVTVIYAERARHAHIPRAQGQRFKWCDDAKMHVATASAAETQAAEKRERLANLATQVFRDVPQGTGLSWREVHNRIKKLDRSRERPAKKIRLGIRAASSETAVVG